MRRAAAALLLLAGLVSPARAELVLEKLVWELAVPAKGQPRVYAPVGTLKAGPPAVKGKLRARLTLKNRGPVPVEGILLRYAMTARLANPESSSAGVWAVPFTVEEKRVPRIGPNQLLEVNLGPSPMLELYFKRLNRTGLWPDELKIQVMIEPYRRSNPNLQMLEKILPVSFERAS